MSLSKNLWKDDKGFMWMLAVSILSLVSTQINTGLILESKLIVRVGYFLFIVIAIKSSSLGFTGKSVGYAVRSCLLVMTIIMIWYEPQTLILSYIVGATGYMVYIIALVINQIFTGSIITVYKIGGGIGSVISGHFHCKAGEYADQEL